MFWRFGFHACSAIDTLLDKPDVTLEEILGEDDLLQECKAHNTKLLEYLRDPNVLAKLLNYIIGDEQIDDKAKFKYSYVACEVLCCEIWSISETVAQSRELLSNFWSFLDRPPPLNPLQASYFTKVNEQFLEKKTPEMIPFIKSIPNVVSKLLRHIETSAIMDLLLKIISMEKSDVAAGIVDWLHDQGLISVLLNQMNPNVEPERQTTVADVLKAIIAISANSSDAGVIGPNALSRDLVSEATIKKILDYMLDPIAPHSTASLTNGVSLIIELIRKNNSDYDVEPVLNTTLQTHPPTNRDPIYLGTLLRLFASRMTDFQKLLGKPKSVPPSIATTFGHIEPLGFERFRICELYAELLHCSNMILLNDPRGEAIVRERDIERDRLKKEGRAQPPKIDAPKVDIWGDADLGNARFWGTDVNSSDGSENKELKDHAPDNVLNSGQIRHDINETPVASVVSSPSTESTSKDTENAGQKDSIPSPVTAVPEQKATEDLSSEVSTETESFFDRDSQSTSAPATQIDSKVTDDSTKVAYLITPEHSRPVVGDYLKMQFVEAKVLPSVVDLFFAHPWNNFLHNVVYDILTQVLNGPMDKGFNRQLVVDLFTTGQLTEKILRGQKASDEAQSQEKGVRLGYMGHLTLIAEEVLKLAERVPLDLLDPTIVQKLTSPEWNEYVDVTLNATRTRDNAILGGVRPQPAGFTLNSTLGGPTSELGGVEENAVLAAIVGRGLNYENGDGRHGDEFEDDQEDREATEEPFVRYMSQSLTNDLPDKFGSSDEDDDDEEVVGWMGEAGDFESRDHENDDADDDDDDMRQFGRASLFHERWEEGFNDDDDFAFRGVGATLSAEEGGVNSSDDEDDVDDEDLQPTTDDLDHEINLDRSDLELPDQMADLGLVDQEKKPSVSMGEEKSKSEVLTPLFGEIREHSDRSEKPGFGDETTVPEIGSDDVD